MEAMGGNRSRPAARACAGGYVRPSEARPPLESWSRFGRSCASPHPARRPGSRDPSNRTSPSLPATTHAREGLPTCRGEHATGRRHPNHPGASGVYPCQPQGDFHPRPEPRAHGRPEPRGPLFRRRWRQSLPGSRSPCPPDMRRAPAAYPGEVQCASCEAGTFPVERLASEGVARRTEIGCSRLQR
jgi:hypothetical protein